MTASGIVLPRGVVWLLSGIISICTLVLTIGVVPWAKSIQGSVVELQISEAANSAAQVAKLTSIDDKLASMSATLAESNQDVEALDLRTRSLEDRITRLEERLERPKD